MLKKPKIRNLKLLKKVRTISFITILIGLVNKNFKLLLRSRSSALIVLLGPLLIIGLVGAAFNTTDFYNINIGTYSGSYNDLTASVIEELEDKNFNVLATKSKDDCISGIKRSELHVCAIFPDDMKIGSEDGVTFYVDKTRMNLVWLILDSISSKISSKTSELSKELTSVLLNTLGHTITEIKDKQEALSNAIESNTKISGELVSFSEDLKDMDLEYSTKDLGLDHIKSALDSVSGSGVDTSSFEDAISETENKSYVIAGKFSDARKKVDEMLISMSTLDTSVKSSLDTMRNVGNSLSSIMGRINTIEYTEAETIVSPIKTKIEPVVAEKTHLSNMFPTLIILIIMFIGLLLASTLVVREKTSSSYFRNFITPTKDGMFLFGDYLTNVLVLGLQVLVIFLVALAFFKGSLWSVMLSSSFVLLLVISVFVLLGLLIGQIFNSEETSTLGAICVGAILLFFSSTILPLETLPQTIRSVANFNPFVIGESMLKEVMLFNADFFVLIEPILMLLVYILVLGGFLLIARKVSKRFI